MPSPYGLEIIEGCLVCPLRQDRIFCDLPTPAMNQLQKISSLATYPKGSVLFVEGQEARGVFILCNGRVKLSATAADGKSLIMRIAEGGEIIGLPGTISSKPYEVTAETLEPLQANFIARDSFLRFLREHGDAAFRVAQVLSDIYHATCKGVRYVGLSSSAAEKLARFLLDWDARGKSADDVDGTRSVITLTHTEIAEMIGTSRETVTRLFADFKRKGLIEVHGSNLVIVNKSGLREFMGQ
ncbi:MAG: Crp/Fnr family transcriptional regulator [Terriglobales bacterium]|jgi:CRP/FNR family transcriptional regulator|nr:Crp/Fnr family transcriptional regulator [Terriglobales bacterium]